MKKCLIFGFFIEFNHGQDRKLESRIYVCSKQLFSVFLFPLRLRFMDMLCYFNVPLSVNLLTVF
jgi:hypothetical protein